MDELCFIDIETTGSIFGYHEIVDIAAIRTSPDAKKILDKINIKLKPQFPDRITTIAESISNYNVVDWENAVEPNLKFWNSIKSFWNGCIPICHNPGFERAFITIAMLKFDIKDTGLGYHWIGTESLFWPWILNKKIEKISLSKILSYFNLPVEPIPHTAINGANACRMAYLEIIKRVKIKELTYNQ